MNHVRKVVRNLERWLRLLALTLFAFGIWLMLGAKAARERWRNCPG